MEPSPFSGQIGDWSGSTRPVDPWREYFATGNVLHFDGTASASAACVQAHRKGEIMPTGWCCDDAIAIAGAATVPVAGVDRLEPQR